MQRPHPCTLYAFLTGVIVAVFMPTPSHATQRDWLMSLPLVSVGRDSPLGLEFNIMNEFSLGVHLGLVSKGEELGKKEQEDHPGTSLETHGQDISLIFQRFSNPAEMAGLHWGINLGYRQIRATWIRDPEQSSAGIFPALDEEGNMHHHLRLEGTSLGIRFGYRFVADSPGFMAGIYLKARHFQSRVRDDDPPESGELLTEIPPEDAIALKRRMMSSLLAGIEIGWAF